MTPTPVSQSLRLLIVEDEALIADELQHRLEALGHAVVAVCDTADTAVATAGTERPDLVLMDIRLKGRGDGIEAAERIYAQFGLPVVYLTAHSDQATFARAKAGAGIFGYLIKPVQERELVIAIDVAMQRGQHSAELYENVLSCEAVVREMADGVLVTDERGAVRAMNRAAEVLTSWNLAAAQGRPLAEVLRLQESPGAPDGAALAAWLREGRRVEIKDAPLPRTDGTLRSVWVTATPVFDRQSRPVGAVTVVRDISDRKTAADAQRASRAKTEFLSRMSHEVRTPLNAMLGFTELLISDVDDELSTRQRQRLDLVMDAARHLRGLIDDVMDVSLIEAGQLPVRLGAVELASLARRHGVLLQPQYRGGSSTAVHADPLRLRQALVNVITNAIKYNRRGGGVRLAVRQDDQHWAVEVSDDGLGMTADQMSHLFEPFNRLGREGGIVEGTGLGLSLTRQLLQRMDGDIHVRSQEGVGTRVVLRLMAASAAAQGVAPAHRDSALAVPPPMPETALSGSILYIEDNPVNSLLVEQFLRRWPAVRVDTAADGASGLDLAAALQPDLILLDMHLPDMDGVELLRRLHERPATRGLRVVALSASALPGDVERARGAGALDYLTKPLDFKAFERGLRRSLPLPTAS
jgi:PAS domain S-box-containing protein